MDVLRSHQDAELRCIFPSGTKIAEGYHITEVKNLHIEAVDCGGAPDAWRETIIQLWVPATPDPAHRMPAGKALKILDKAHSLRPMAMDSECLFEVEEEAGTAVVYSLVSVEPDRDDLVMHLMPRKTQCKANDRAPEPVAAGCCGGSKRCG